MTKYGLLLPSREVVLWGGSDPRVLIDLAVTAERAGFDSVWAGDSITARPRFEPLVLLGAVASATTSLELGTAVYLPLLRHPTVSAHAIATLDRLCAGRLVIGVGAGASVPATDEELEAVGGTPGRRVSRLVETTEHWKRAWTADADRALQPAPAAPGGPPVWLAGGGPRMLRLAGERFDGWLPYSPTPDAFREAWATVRAAAAEAGRNPDALAAAVYLTVTVEEAAPDPASELDAFMNGYYGLPLELMSLVQACHCGTVATAAEWIRAYEAAGASHVVVRLGHRDLGVHADVAARLLDAVRRRPLPT